MMGLWVWFQSQGGEVCDLKFKHAKRQSVGRAEILEM